MKINGITATVKKFLGESKALDEQQTDDEARIGMMKREFAEHPSKGLTPARLYAILEAAEQGDLKAQHELFADMEEKDSQISSDLAKRRQHASELEWQIVAPPNATAQEKKAAEWCAEVFGTLDVEDLIIELGSGIGHGWINLELQWEMNDGQRIIKQPEYRPHSWFKLHPDDQNRIMLNDNSYNGDDLWFGGWVQHRHRAKAGYIARGGLHRTLAWPYLFQNYALGDLAELLERYGIPIGIAKYPSGASDKEKASLLRTIVNLGHRGAGIINEQMAVDFHQAASGTGDVYKIMLDWCERSKSKAILGGTLTSGTGEGTNTNALGNVHERGLTSLINSDVRQYASTIRRDILFPLALFNFGIDNINRAPIFYLDTGEPEDYKVLADTLPVFVDMGAKVPMWWFHEKTKIPEAQDGEDYLQPKIIAPVANLKQPMAALKANPAIRADATDAQLEHLQQQGDAAIGEWTERIRELVNTVESLEELKDRLIEVYPDLNDAQFAQAMGDALAAAHIAGRSDIVDGL